MSDWKNNFIHTRLYYKRNLSLLLIQHLIKDANYHQHFYHSEITLYREVILYKISIISYSEFTMFSFGKVNNIRTLEPYYLPQIVPFKYNLSITTAYVELYLTLL